MPSLTLIKELVVGSLVLLATSECSARFSGTLSAEFETAYVSPSGTICDSRPTALQNLDWMLTLGNYGRFSGYGAFLSMLHDHQHELHRPAFNEFEGSIRYGYAWTLAKDVVFINDTGFVANPLFGYRNGNDVTLWEFRYFQSLENPYVTPYWDLLTMMDPAQWNRIRFGVRHSFALTETITLMPFVEAVWGDKNRFKARYGESPDDTFLGGVICTLTPGVQLDWRFAEDWRAYAKFRELVTVDSLARRLVGEMDDYWEVNDLAIGTIGMAYDF